MLVIFGLGYGIISLVPVFSLGKIPSVANPLHGLILFVFLSGFLINQTMSRNKTLHVSITLELSRTRRIMHLIENIEANARWKKEVKKSLVAYLQSIGAHDFATYHTSDASFRDLTHEIYAFVPKTKKDEMLYEELLFITREIAFQRQELTHGLSSPISPYTWIIFFLVGVIDIVLILLIRDESLLAMWYVFFITVIIFLIADLLIELNVLTKSKRRAYQKMYVENSERVAKG